MAHTPTTELMIPEPEDQFYIRTTSGFADEHDLVLKQGETFAVLDRHGDIRPVGLHEEGLYHDGTRHLSRLSIRIGGLRPMLLSSAVKEDNTLVAVDLTNVDVAEHGAVVIPRGTLYVARVMIVWDGALHEHLTVRNYGAAPIGTWLTVAFDADYSLPNR